MKTIIIIVINILVVVIQKKRLQKTIIYIYIYFNALPNKEKIQKIFQHRKNAAIEYTMDLLLSVFVRHNQVFGIL